MNGSLVANLLESHLSAPLIYGVPCSVLGPLLTALEDAAPDRYTVLSNEGEAVAAGIGSAMGGRDSIIYLQNSGLGNAINPLTSLVTTCEASLLLVIGYRGAPGSVDEPQHMTMGALTKDVLTRAGVSVTELSATTDVDELRVWLDETRDRTRAILVHQGAIVTSRIAHELPAYDGPARAEAVKAIATALPAATSLIATTGMIGRELAHLAPRARNFYMVGSMGCAASIALGLARATGGHHVVLDGDGAIVMRLESMIGLAQVASARVDHVVLDNGLHETTGGQRSTSRTVDLCAAASATGYSSAATRSLDQLVDELSSPRPAGVRFHRLEVGLSEGPRAPRPHISPQANYQSVRESYLGGAA